MYLVLIINTMDLKKRIDDQTEQIKRASSTSSYCQSRVKCNVKLKPFYCLRSQCNTRFGDGCARASVCALALLESWVPFSPKSQALSYDYTPAFGMCCVEQQHWHGGCRSHQTLVRSHLFLAHSRLLSVLPTDRDQDLSPS